MRAPKRELHVLVAEQPHTGLRKEALRGIFGPGVNFMVAVAPEDAEGRTKVANFIDAISQRVRGPGNEISGDDGEIRAELVGHFHRTANVGAAHVATEVNVAKLDDLHAVQSRRQIRGGNLDAVDAVVQALGREAVHHAEEGSSAGQG